ncbi:hypothetical protein AJ80_07915 [Polytolypa hystricis UAMH7299]|uniref:Apple domain-containing protein n=1 Tax=Polytolypa hystricis (strain UAMH7299) TaxID=1447883 RepID=A0A2B7XH67_POLH7|nr:hypothetical protein AJ80_07915 [Polytolypa hystricis UAMH7299]
MSFLKSKGRPTVIHRSEPIPSEGPIPYHAVRSRYSEAPEVLHISTQQRRQLAVPLSRESGASTDSRISEVEGKSIQPLAAGATVQKKSGSRRFWILTIVAAVIIIGAAVGGGVGGAIVARQRANCAAAATAASTSPSLTPTHSSPPASPTATTPTTPSSPEKTYFPPVATDIETLGLPTGLPPPCPSNKLTSPSNSSATFLSECDITYNSPRGQNTTPNNNVGGAIAYSYHDCLEACVALNKFQGQDMCKIVSFAVDMRDAVEIWGVNCWLKRVPEGEEGGQYKGRKGEGFVISGRLCRDSECREVY